MDTTKIERIAPEYWMSSHLSIADIYGCYKINGTYYILDKATNELVREDVLKREAKERRAAKNPPVSRNPPPPVMAEQTPNACGG